MNRGERVGMLFGGVSGEHEVSIASGQAVRAGLEEAGYNVVPIYIARDGTWTLADDGTTVLLGSGRLLYRQAGGSLTELCRLDVVFPVLHGPMGEDGTVQGLLEVAEVPYVGAGVLGAAVSMDKIVMKLLFRQAGLPVPDFVAVTRRRVETDCDAVAREVEERLAYPCFVKPANLGSSVGISKANDRAGLLAALYTASRYDRRILVEQGIDGREIEVSVLGNDAAEASVPGEVIPAREFYDYVAKYGDIGSETLIPAPVNAAVAEEVRDMAVRAFRVLDLAGMARVDFLLERASDRVFINEANAIPGFTKISMYAKLWDASGVRFPELVTRLVELAHERFAERQRSLQAAREVVLDG